MIGDRRKPVPLVLWLLFIIVSLTIIRGVLTVDLSSGICNCQRAWVVDLLHILVKVCLFIGHLSLWYLRLVSLSMILSWNHCGIKAVSINSHGVIKSPCFASWDFTNLG